MLLNGAELVLGRHVQLAFYRVEFPLQAIITLRGIGNFDPGLGVLFIQFSVPLVQVVNFLFRTLVVPVEFVEVIPFFVVVPVQGLVVPVQVGQFLVQGLVPRLQSRDYFSVSL